MLPSPFDLLETVHVMLLAGFVMVTSVLLTLTVRRWMQLVGKVLRWRTGSFLGLPTWPTVFLILVTALLTVSLALDLSPSVWIMAGYLLGGLFWLAATTLSTAVVVTEEGLWLRIHAPAPTLHWDDVCDYFHQPQSDGHRFVFFSGHGRKRGRLQLVVPNEEMERFLAVVATRVDARFEWQAVVQHGKQTAK